MSADERVASGIGVYTIAICGCCVIQLLGFCSEHVLFIMVSYRFVLCASVTVIRVVDTLHWPTLHVLLDLRWPCSAAAAFHIHRLFFFWGLNSMSLFLSPFVILQRVT